MAKKDNKKPSVPNKDTVYKVNVLINSSKTVDDINTYVLKKLNKNQWKCLYYSDPNIPSQDIKITEIPKLGDFLEHEPLSQTDIWSIEEVIEGYHVKKVRSTLYNYTDFFYATLRLINSQPNRQRSPKIDNALNRKYAFDPLLLQELKNNEIYKELIRNKNIDDALKKFRKKPFYKSKVVINHHEAYELFFIGIIAYCYADYIANDESKKNKKEQTEQMDKTRIKNPLTKKYNSAIKASEKLLELMNDDGIKLQNSKATSTLRFLLGKLIQEQINKKNDSSQTRQSGNITTRIFVENLFGCFSLVFKELHMDIVNLIQEGFSNNSYNEEHIKRVKDQFQPSHYKLNIIEFNRKEELLGGCYVKINSREILQKNTYHLNAASDNTNHWVLEYYEAPDNEPIIVNINEVPLLEDYLKNFTNSKIPEFTEQHKIDITKVIKLYHGHNNDPISKYKIYYDKKEKKFLLVYIDDISKWFFCGLTVNNFKIFGFIDEIDTLVTLNEEIYNKKPDYFKKKEAKKTVLYKILSILGYTIPNDIKHSGNHVQIDSLFVSKRVSQFNERHKRLAELPQSPPENYF